MKILAFLISMLLTLTTVSANYEDGKEVGGDVIGGEYAPAVTGEFNGHTYALFLESITWEEARDYCVSVGGHLATVTSQEEHDFVSVMDNGNSHSVWIGGYRDSSFKWYWVTGEEWNYTNWLEGEPNDAGNENCAALWPDMWNDLSGENIYEQSGFICEWDEIVDGGQDKPVTGGEYTPVVTAAFNGHTYALFLESMTWEEAREYCISIGGHLATVTSQEEHDFVSVMDNGNYHDVWIGGYRDSSFVWYWVTDEEWDYTNWQEGEPNNSSNVIGNEYCAALWPDAWNDLNSENVYEQSGFICEWDNLTDDGQGVPDGLDKPVDEKVSPLSVITYKGHTYKLFDDTMKWTEARAYCESIGGHLATVSDAEENELLASLMENGERDTYWLGSGAGSYWIWVTEEPFDYTNFAEGHGDVAGETLYLKMINIPDWTTVRGEWQSAENEISYTTADGEIIENSVGFICEWDDFIVDNEHITSVKIDSTENKISVDIDFEENPAAFSFAALYGAGRTEPKDIHEENGKASLSFDEMEGNRKYKIKLFFWDENLRPLSKPVETEIFVK